MSIKIEPTAIAVTQDDREAAAKLAHVRLDGAKVRGSHEGIGLYASAVQAFARHRIAAEQRAAAPVASVDAQRPPRQAGDLR